MNELAGLPWAWNSQVELNEVELDLPSRAIEPSTFVVASQSDLFHASVCLEWIERAFEQIESNQRHQFVLISKRCKRMNEVVSDYWGDAVPENITFGANVENQSAANGRLHPLLYLPSRRIVLGCFPLIGAIDFNAVPNVTNTMLQRLTQVTVGAEPERPAKSEWIVSIEDQLKSLGVPVIRDSSIIGINHSYDMAEHILYPINAFETEGYVLLS